jgi:hypothetical protein
VTALKAEVSYKGTLRGGLGDPRPHGEGGGGGIVTVGSVTVSSGKPAAGGGEQAGGGGEGGIGGGEGATGGSGGGAGSGAEDGGGGDDEGSEDDWEPVVKRKSNKGGRKKAGGQYDLDERVAALRI